MWIRFSQVDSLRRDTETEAWSSGYPQNRLCKLGGEGGLNSPVFSHELLSVRKKLQLWSSNADFLMPVSQVWWYILCFVCICLLNRTKIYSLNPFLSVQFTGIKYIHMAVQSSPPSTFITFSSSQMKTLYLLNNNPSIIPYFLTPQQPTFYFLSL